MLSEDPICSCYEREGNDTSATPACGEDCQSPSEQYWERRVLGLHKAPTEWKIDPYNDTETVNNTYVLYNFGDIGEISWELRKLFEQRLLVLSVRIIDFLESKPHN